VFIVPREVGQRAQQSRPDQRLEVVQRPDAQVVMQMADQRRAETGELKPRRECRRDFHGRVGRRFDPPPIAEEDDLLGEVLADSLEFGQLPPTGELAGILREARDEPGRLPVGPDPEGVGVLGFQLVGDAVEP